MKITIQDVDHEFDLDTMTNDEAMKIEAAIGMPFGKFGTALGDGSATALTALVWIVQRRDNPSLRYGDVHFTFGELKMEQDAVDPTETPEAPPTDA